MLGLFRAQIDNDEFTNDPNQLPSNFEMAHIMHYCLHTKSHYTWQDFMCYKSLESYNQFINGWVSNLRACRKSNLIILMAQVKHSQSANKPPLEPWLITELDGKVLCAHCTCMAGLGEVCTHVSATLFLMEAMVKIRNNQTVTDKPAYWLIPTVTKKVDYATVSDIDFRLNLLKNQV